MKALRKLRKAFGLFRGALWRHRAIAVAAVEEISALTAGKTDDEIVDALQMYGLDSHRIGRKPPRNVVAGLLLTAATVALRRKAAARGKLLSEGRARTLVQIARNLR